MESIENTDVSSISHIHVIQYNVLSSALATMDGAYPLNNKCDLDTSIRRCRVMKKVIDEVSRVKTKDSKVACVVCLQEVEECMASLLNDCLSRLHDMQMITVPYGSKKNGYMGVAMFYTKNLVREFGSPMVFSIRIASTLETSGYQEPPLHGFEYTQPPVMINYAERKWMDALGTDWHAATEKNNALLVVDFQSFVVATYHMPCLFERPAAMLAHAVAVLKVLEKIKKPFILATDFNTSPDSQLYDFVTGQKRMDYYKHTMITGQPIHSTWRPVLEEPVTSAHYQVHGSEPEFTTSAASRTTTLFKGTLDYIFCSREDWEIHDARVINACADHMPPDGHLFLPNEREPSDHLMLVADVSLQHRCAMH